MPGVGDEDDGEDDDGGGENDDEDGGGDEDDAPPALPAPLCLEVGILGMVLSITTSSPTHPSSWISHTAQPLEQQRSPSHGL